MYVYLERGGQREREIERENQVWQITFGSICLIPAALSTLTDTGLLDITFCFASLHFSESVS